MASEDLGDALARVNRRFDLNDYETDAYLAVLDGGRLTASAIADRTDIPQPRVYDTVRSLEERGLVELRESRPITVLAIDPEEAFSDVHTSLDSLVCDLKTRYTAPARDAEAASLVKSRSTILRYLETTIETADYELILSLTPELVDRFEEELVAKQEANVATELLLTPAADAADDYDYTAIATAVRARRGLTTPIIAVADGTHAVYATQDALAADSEHYGVVFNRSELGFLVSGFFNTLLWTTAETICDTGDGRSFPRRYASIRRCVADLRTTPGAFFVTVEGRDTETGEHRSVSGRIGDIDSDEANRTATITVETEDGNVTVGGQVATFEDVEAHEIRIERR
ncbi:MAG TPA: TrmB family transcriptional regulator [Halococcus sp.]|nr:TrmB family transcriptional regulator [Halococcus sp.]